MNKKLIVFALIVAALGLAWWLISRNGWSTLKPELKDFSIKDTASIEKIFLADKRDHSVTLNKKENGTWWVNDSYEADVTKVNLLLATMKELAVRNPIPENAFNTVVATLATDAVKAIFYDKNGEVKTIYIGPATPDQTGTYMMIEGSKSPFVTHIPGFVGYLTPRFYPFAIKWKNKLVCNAPFDEIAKVSVEYPKQPNESFSIAYKNGFSLTDKNTSFAIADTNFARYYLSSFRNLYVEGYEETYTGAKADSIKALIPFCKLNILLTNGTEIKLQVHDKNVTRKTMQQYDEDGNPLLTDPEKYYAFLNDEKDVVYIQEYVFGKIFRKRSEFVNGPNPIPQP
jgi:hypothetical protein